MKKILVLTIALVMALSVSAFAADIKTSGKVWFNVNDLLVSPMTTANGYRLQFDGTVSDKGGFRVRFEDSSLLKRAYYYEKTEFGKVVVGKTWDDFSMLSNNYTGENLSQAWTGVALYPSLGDKTTAFGFYDITAKAFGAQAKFNADVATVYGGFSKVDVADPKYAVGASVPLGQFTVYGQYDAQGSTNEQFVGAKASVGVDVAAEYKVKAKTITLNATKTLGDVEFSATYTKPDVGNGTLELDTTLYF